MRKFFENLIYYGSRFFKFFFKSAKWVVIFLGLPIAIAYMMYKKRVEKEINY